MFTVRWQHKNKAIPFVVNYVTSRSAIYEIIYFKIILREASVVLSKDDVSHGREPVKFKFIESEITIKWPSSK